jgi:septation ring formation regulator EzrA
MGETFSKAAMKLKPTSSASDSASEQENRFEREIQNISENASLCHEISQFAKQFQRRL